MNHKKALEVIILFGLVSLFGDIAYEASRSINGPYLRLLAADAAIVGLIAGVGEFLGYALRLASGYFSDKTRAYWFFVFLGYGLIICVPLLSLAGIWQAAAIFIILERIGKAIRSPARDTILCSASKEVGTGFGFGLHEAMDQIGAIAGPLILAAFFMLGPFQKGVVHYQRGYQLLWVPYLALVCCLILAYLRLPHPERLEGCQEGEETPERFSSLFRLYSIFTFVTTLGFANFILLGYHFKTTGILSDTQIPLFYALAMGVDAVTALGIGKIYDMLKMRKRDERAGLNTLVIIPILALTIPIMAFSKVFSLCLIGVFVWGIVMGSHETIMRSAIADIVHSKRRGMGYGIFNTTYGMGLFLGSALLGFLYSYSINLLIIVTAFLQLVALMIFIKLRRWRS